MEGFLFLMRWFHFLAGITWIGVLYYFNFIQTPFFATADPAVRSGMIRGVVPNALWWFRWGAMFTFLTGWIIVLTKLHLGGVSGQEHYLTLILTGGAMGTLMWANVWFVIWPAQKIVIASAEQVASGGEAIPEAAARGQRAGLASVILLVELNALIGPGLATQKPLSSVPGVIHAGVWLTVVLFVLASILL
jgi:uncharacterized membrane protein